jgi:hypothetical protein
LYPVDINPGVNQPAVAQQAQGACQDLFRSAGAGLKSPPAKTDQALNRIFMVIYKWLFVNDFQPKN